MVLSWHTGIDLKIFDRLRTAYDQDGRVLTPWLSSTNEINLCHLARRMLPTYIPNDKKKRASLAAIYRGLFPDVAFSPHRAGADTKALKAIVDEMVKCVK